MANRWGNQFKKSLVKEVWSIYAKVTFGASGAPTLVQGNPPGSAGVVSITQNATGTYTFVFGTTAGNLDVWNRILTAQVYFNSGTATPAAPIMYTITDSVATAGTCSLKVGLTTGGGGSLTNPASGEIGYFEFIFANSNAP